MSHISKIELIIHSLEDLLTLRMSANVITQYVSLAVNMKSVLCGVVTTISFYGTVIMWEG